MEFTLVTWWEKISLEAGFETGSEIGLKKRGITGEHIVTPLKSGGCPKS